jgi:hypothetical protein
LAGNKDLQDILLQKVMANPQLLSGSTGSRLISGNSSVASITEAFIAENISFLLHCFFHQDITLILLYSPHFLGVMIQLLWMNKFIAPCMMPAECQMRKK